jgi:demethylmenaquinone methyltransferase/2-methoxy-6-polyprenyl-1,4-benzoquinol methylase
MIPRHEAQPNARAQASPYTDEGRRKASYVKSMFAAIVDRYDLLNGILSLRRDQAWRRYAASSALATSGCLILDVASGTGELARHVLSQGHDATVVGLDFSPPMLTKARERLSSAIHNGRIRPVLGDILQLPFPDATFDAVTFAFGLRNVADMAQALRELARVAKPGAPIVILELTRPPYPAIRQLHALGMFALIPAIGRLVSGNGAAFVYLPESIMGLVSPDDVTRLMNEAGIRDVTTRHLTLGIATVWSGTNTR